MTNIPTKRLRGYYYFYLENGVRKRGAGLFPRILKGFEIDLWKANHKNYFNSGKEGDKIDGIRCWEHSMCRACARPDCPFSQRYPFGNPLNKNINHALETAG